MKKSGMFSGGPAFKQLSIETEIKYSRFGFLHVSLSGRILRQAIK